MSLFSAFERLCSSKNDDRLLTREWDRLTSQMARPTVQNLTLGEPLLGHIPHSESAHVWDVAPKHFNCRGVYVWGAWAGSRARVQYIGIADHQTMRDRFAGLRGRTGRYRDELRNGRRFMGMFRALPEAFTYSEPLSLERYRAVGIKVRDYQRTRPPRSERYAKIGLTNLWYFVIPAPGEPVRRKNGESFSMDGELCDLERKLIQLTSANLFRRFEQGEPMAFPLLNRKEVLPNRFIQPTSQAYGAFARWLNEGPWWWEMDDYVKREAPALLTGFVS